MSKPIQDMSEPKYSSEYEQTKAKAPRILAEMVQMLLTWRKMGFHVPRGVKNIFEFTWEDLLVLMPRKSFTGLYCPVVKFVSPDEENFSPTCTPRAPKFGPTPSGMAPNFMTPSLENQQMLLKFQQRSVHLLSELLKMKMKIMIDAVAGPSAEEIARRFLETGQQLSPKNQEEAAEFLTKDPRKKGGRGAVAVVPAIPISSTTQLIQQVSFSCLCFSLAFKESKPRKDFGKGGSSQDSNYDERLDPCPQAREKLREICKRIEQEKAAFVAKGHTRPLIVRHYVPLLRSPSMALKRFPSGQQLIERKSTKGKKFHFAFPDGSSFMFYPSGHVAVCQFPVCCLGKTITLLFHTDQTLLGTFLSHGQSCVSYSFHASCSVALLMDQEGGSVRDKDGYLTHRWSWYSKNQILQSLEFQITDHLKLKVLGQYSMMLSFTSLSETLNLSLSRVGCPHRHKAEKRLLTNPGESENKEIRWNKVLGEIKRRFEKTVRQFINGVLIASGICCIEYPFGVRPKQVRFSLKVTPQAWERRLKEESNAIMADSKWKSLKPGGVRTPLPESMISYKPFKEQPKLPPQGLFRPKTGTAGETQLVPDTWATCPADCPIVLRKVLAKEDNVLCCKCVVKIPLITDFEFEKFITAQRDPQQVLVICVVSSQNHSYSPFFEWSLEKLYIQMQHGRPSPCVQSKHDPYRFLKYDLDCPMNKNPPLLVEKHAVSPGMVVMYAGGKLLFGGCVFNGYSYSKRDLLKQINQARLDCKTGLFLPQSFKFSTNVSFWTEFILHRTSPLPLLKLQ
ncbi:uncharacterized protein C3orf20 homolog isoform X2 [Hemicordylus capensis]|uniref:uncharacterized protein C3orf20 homolog isoform X2 n=1 Tax=Hemicordylus capensis TaxID=884348 RepID=UPI0023032910|nr:uncharacterized protein C3orf20 homolog isoform X2 [Hemicordylus capensis]